MLCEKCGKREAVFHWTELMEGSILDRHLCAECRDGELPGGVRTDEVRFQCRCGGFVSWRLPTSSCGHEPEEYEKVGRRDVDIATCSCGIRFVARATFWRCRLCGAESVLPPRKTGVMGYLHDHIYGFSPQAAEIEIRGVMP